jgi:hypothetical protein
MNGSTNIGEMKSDCCERGLVATRYWDGVRQYGITLSYLMALGVGSSQKKSRCISHESLNYFL